MTEKTLAEWIESNPLGMRKYIDHWFGVSAAYVKNLIVTEKISSETVRIEFDIDEHYSVPDGAYHYACTVERSCNGVLFHYS